MVAIKKLKSSTFNNGLEDFEREIQIMAVSRTLVITY